MILTYLTVAIVVSLVFLVSGAIMVAVSERKGVEWTGCAFILISGLAIGSCLTLLWSNDQWHRPPRVPNVAGVVWEGNTVTFQPPTEESVQWCLISSKTGAQGVFVPGNRYEVDEGETDLMVYLRFPGESSTPASIKQRTAAAPGASTANPAAGPAKTPAGT